MKKKTSHKVPRELQLMEHQSATMSCRENHLAVETEVTTSEFEITDETFHFKKHFIEMECVFQRRTRHLPEITIYKPFLPF